MTSSPRKSSKLSGSQESTKARLTVPISRKKPESSQKLLTLVNIGQILVSQSCISWLQIRKSNCCVTFFQWSFLIFSAFLSFAQCSRIQICILQTRRVRCSWTAARSTWRTWCENVVAQIERISNIAWFHRLFLHVRDVHRSKGRPVQTE